MCTMNECVSPLPKHSTEKLYSAASDHRRVIASFRRTKQEGGRGIPDFRFVFRSGWNTPPSDAEMRENQYKRSAGLRAP